MATYELPVNSQFSESGDDLYFKPTDGDFSGVSWVNDSVSAIEIADTNVYEVVLDETKGYIGYLNTHSQSCTADAGTDVFTASSHGLLDGDTIRLKSPEGTPAGLEQSTIYYVRDKTTHTFKLAATAGGVALDLSAVGSGVITFTAPGMRSKDDVKIGTVPQVRDAALVGEAELAAISAKIDAVKAKTDFLGTVRSLIRW